MSTYVERAVPSSSVGGNGEREKKRKEVGALRKTTPKEVAL